MTIQLSAELEGIIQRHLSSGRYNSAAEVLRDALELLEERGQSPENVVAGLDHKIAEGLESLDKGEWVDGEEFFEKLRQREETIRQSRK